MHSFRSDNNAGLCPEALAALAAANDGSHVVGYGDDAVTARAVAAFHDVFGPDVGVWFVGTGTAANTLAIAALTETWEQIVCHGHSHLNDDESTAPERLTHCRITPIHTRASKLVPAEIEAVAQGVRGDVHQPQPGVVSISNVNEFGGVYTPEEVRAISDVAHAAGYRVHVDGARFANAVAAIGCAPNELAGAAGIDALSFGGTKNGLAFGEAVLFFRQEANPAWFERAQHAFPYHRKGTGHLLSKHRFVAAPFEATLTSGAWLSHARHANAMASRLAAGLESCGLTLRYPADANGIFVELPPRVDEALQSRGHGYYGFGDPEWNMARLMCSYDTTEADVDWFLSDVAAVVG
ncbi:MAG: threonine aldolase family protein [Planctomycetota bacterium]|jgi:threonine aldolase